MLPTKPGFSSGCSGGCKIDDVFKDNLLYAAHNLGGGSDWLIRMENQSVEFPTALNPGYNLFSTPGFTNMFSGYTPRANDKTNQTPSFVDSATGDYTLATGSADSSVIITLAPGVYTAQVSGANNASGTALIEIYELP